MSPSYLKVHNLLDEGKVAGAANEFQSIFAPAVNKLCSEAGKSAPKRYMMDAKWPSRVKDLHALTDKAQKCLNGGDKKASREALESLRKFFFYLHAANRMVLSSDGVYAFKKRVDRIPDNGELAQSEIAKLRALKVKIGRSTPSGRAKTDKPAFCRDFKQWSAEVKKILAESPLSSKSIAELKTITNKFYLKYGIDLE